MHLERKALHWQTSIKTRRMKNPSKDGTVTEYQEKFEELEVDLSEDIAVSFFLGGLDRGSSENI